MLLCFVLEVLENQSFLLIANEHYMNQETQGICRRKCAWEVLCKMGLVLNDNNLGYKMGNGLQCWHHELTLSS